MFYIYTYISYVSDKFFIKNSFLKQIGYFKCHFNTTKLCNKINFNEFADKFVKMNPPKEIIVH